MVATFTGGAFTGGEKLEAALKELTYRLGGVNGQVSVGWTATSSQEYADGMNVPTVAAMNEFGGSFTVPEHDVNINRIVKKDGSFARNGRFVKEEVANFQTTHTVPEYQITIPPRPFFRNMIEKNKDGWADFLKKALNVTYSDVTKSLNMLGEEMAGQLYESIAKGTYTPNAKSTIAKKGFDKPLEDSRNMMDSIKFFVK